MSQIIKTPHVVELSPDADLQEDGNAVLRGISRAIDEAMYLGGSAQEILDIDVSAEEEETAYIGGALQRHRKVLVTVTTRLT